MLLVLQRALSTADRVHGTELPVCEWVAASTPRLVFAFDANSLSIP